jgi:hypothetical protein
MCAGGSSDTGKLEHMGSIRLFPWMTGDGTSFPTASAAGAVQRIRGAENAFFNG